MRLPIVADTPEAEPLATAAAGSFMPDMPPRRILVVDDSMDSAESLSLLLGSTGNDTRIANDGVEAIELAQQFRPDLVLLDIGLPRMNGYDVCRASASNPGAAT